MIILSQDKKEFINYDNVRRIRIVDNNYQKEFLKNSGLDSLSNLLSPETSTKINDLKGFGIFAYFDNSDNTMLGQYETEERANKVKEEILETYKMSFQVIYNNLSTPTLIPRPIVYEMPEK